MRSTLCTPRQKSQTLELLEDEYVQAMKNYIAAQETAFSLFSDQVPNHFNEECAEILSQVNQAHHIRDQYFANVRP